MSAIEEVGIFIGGPIAFEDEDGREWSGTVTGATPTEICLTLTTGRKGRLIQDEGTYAWRWRVDQ